MPGISVGSTPQWVPILLIILTVLLPLVPLGTVLYKRKFGPVHVEQAMVAEKFKQKSVSNSLQETQYYVVFQFHGKKRTFQVSEYSYGGYHLHETGTLKYRGDHLIDFH